MSMQMQTVDLGRRCQGCLLGGAIGDALGYSVEFFSINAIRLKYGPNGIQSLVLTETDRSAQISDDTQMTLFTANALLMTNGDYSQIEKCLNIAYQRWLYTQEGRCREGWERYLEPQPMEPYPFIMDNSGKSAIFARRAPGGTCLGALQTGKPVLMSKGSGGVMRVAPIGLLFYNEPERARDVAILAAGITHGHPTGKEAAGALAYIIAYVTQGVPLVEAVKKYLSVYSRSEVGDALEEALYLYRRFPKIKTMQEFDWARAAEVVSDLGEGWIAEEALAIAVFCALIGSRVNKRTAIAMAVNHGGDSDTTGAICGNIVGAMGDGAAGLPTVWKDRVELVKYLRLYAYGLCNMALGRKRKADGSGWTNDK